jgi:NADH pyrophosphatase NudC (nudix superfamily)
MSQVRHFDAFHFCPSCGTQGGSSPSLKQYVCPACDFHYFSNAAAAVIAIIPNAAGEILFVRRGKEPARGMLDLPGGFVDPLETIETALQREVQEEIGAVIREFTYLTSFPNRYAYRGVLYFTIDLVFVCTVEDVPMHPEQGEIEDILFLSPDRIDRTAIGFESVRNTIDYYLARQ